MSSVGLVALDLHAVFDIGDPTSDSLGLGLVELPCPQSHRKQLVHLFEASALIQSQIRPMFKPQRGALTFGFWYEEDGEDPSARRKKAHHVRKTSAHVERLLQQVGDDEDEDKSVNDIDRCTKAHD